LRSRASAAKAETKPSCPATAPVPLTNLIENLIENNRQLCLPSLMQNPASAVRKFESLRHCNRSSAVVCTGMHMGMTVPLVVRAKSNTILYGCQEVITRKRWISELLRNHVVPEETTRRHVITTKRTAAALTLESLLPDLLRELESHGYHPEFGRENFISVLPCPLLN